MCLPVFDTDQGTQRVHPGEHVEDREETSGGMLLPTRTEPNDRRSQRREEGGVFRGEIHTDTDDL